MVTKIKFFFILVDAYWLEWGDWTNCSKACGNGSSIRIRICVPPKYGGQNCSGKGLEEVRCNTQRCEGILNNAML